MKINLIEVFKDTGMAEIAAKGACTRCCKKLEIEHEHGLIEISELQKIYDHYKETVSSKYRDKILVFIKDVLNNSKIKELDENFFTPSNVLITADPFESAFLLPKLIEHLKEKNDFESIIFFEECLFNLKNFVDYKKI